MGSYTVMGRQQYSAAPRDIMRVYAILLSIGIIASTVGAAKDSKGCNEEKQAEFKECTESAYTEYITVWNKGSDGPKEDFYARKSCNYITKTIEECSCILKDCISEEELKKYMNDQYNSALEKVQTNIPNWDSQKCPAAKGHIDSLDSTEVAKDAEDDMCAKYNKNPDPTGSAAYFTASIFCTLIPAMIFM